MSDDLTELPGIGKASAEKLVNAGFDSYLMIAVTSPKSLAEIEGITEAGAAKIVAAAKKKANIGEFITSSELEEKRNNLLRLTTGSAQLDSLFGGRGLESMSISEFFGEFGSGKTQICFQLAVNATLPVEQGGLDGHVLVIDTENTFRPERIRQMATALGLNSDEVFEKIHVARALNSAHQILLLEEKAYEMAKKYPIRLVIVDSLTAHFRAEYIGRGTLGERQGLLNKHMHDLLRFADVNNCVVVVSNQVLSNPGAMFTDPTKPVGGNIVGHNCLSGDTLIQLPNGGLRAIKDMVPGKVYSADFDSGKIVQSDAINITVNPDVKEAYTIKTNMKIVSSPEHRFFTVDNFEIVEKRAEELKVGDYIAQVTQINTPGKVFSAPIISSDKYTISKEFLEEIKHAMNSKNMKVMDLAAELNISGVKTKSTLRRVRFVTLDEALRISRTLDIQFSSSYIIPHDEEYKLPKYITPEFAQIMGYYFGNGKLTEETFKLYSPSSALLYQYDKLCREVFGIGGIVKKQNSSESYTLTIKDKQVCSLIATVGCYVLIDVPMYTFDTITHFLRGYVDAKASIYKSRRIVILHDKREKVLQTVQLLLLRMGIKSSIETNEKTLIIHPSGIASFSNLGFTDHYMNDWLNECKKVEIVDRRTTSPIKIDEMKALFNDIGVTPHSLMRVNNKKEKYVTIEELHSIMETFYTMISKRDTALSDECIRKIKFINNILNETNKYTFEKIRAIYVNPNTEPMYDFSVPGHENYVANGFIVHNSTYRIYLRKGKKGTRVARMIDSPQNPDMEAIIMIDEAGVHDG